MAPVKVKHTGFVIRTGFFLLLTLILIPLFSSSAHAAWYNSNWSYRKAIAIDGSQVVGGPHTDFPVLISFTDTDLAAARADGWDLLFTLDDGTTKLDHEIEDFNNGTGVLVAWVKIPAPGLTNGSDLTIYLYYGYATVPSDQQNIAAVWSNNYDAVWHLNETPNDGAVGGHDDSTGNVLNNDGTPQNFQDGDGGTTNAPGKIAGADRFANQVDDVISIADNAGQTPTGDISFSAWVNVDTITSMMFLQKNNGAIPWFAYQLYINNSGWPFMAWVNSSGTEYNAYRNSPLSTGTWHYIVGMLEGTTVRIYIDGSAAGTFTAATTGTLLDTDASLTIGNSEGYNDSPDGRIDEIRLASAARSAAWVQTEYNNQFNPGAGGFLKTVGAQEASWYNSNWLYRKALNLDGGKFCTTVNAFPVPITLTGDADLQADAQPLGLDILFTADDGVTKLSHEIETFTKANGDLTAWIKLDIVSGVSQTIYMYYGNSGATDQQDTANVWDTNFNGVWHMSEEVAGPGNTGVYKDSTSNANHGDDDVSATGQTGQINGGQEFDGTDDQVNFGSGASLNIRNAITMSAWVNMSSRPPKGDWYNLHVKGNYIYNLYLQGADTDLTTLGAEFELDSGNKDLWKLTSIDIDPANGWAHVAVTFDGTDVKFYVNGALDHTENEPGIIDDSAGSDLIFTDDEKEWFAGFVDEIRISDTALSAEWIQAEVCTAGGVVGGTGPPEYPAVTSAVAEIAPNAVGVSSTANAFTYDIRPTIGVNDTGVNQVVVTAPPGYAGLAVTGVSVGGSGLTAGGSCPTVGAGEYCTVVAGQDITVSLGTKVTVSGTNINVNFTADAPGATGSADFTSTVDDTGTTSPRQNTIEGDGNNDGGGDGNDWTVVVADNAVSTAVAEITPNDVPIFSLSNSFTYDIAITITGGDTGVDQVTVTVPATFGDPVVTAVRVGGTLLTAGADYTDNTSGKLIDILLSTPITSTDTIQVIFTSDGPTAVDAVGKNFTSTVDDSTTPTPAQATAEGNGDADGGDANNWTVTASNGNLALVKKAFFSDGTPIASGATIPQGTPFKFLIYINNRAAARGDVSLQDVLNAAFGYQTGSMKVTNAVGECAADTCTAPEEDAIFTAVNSGAAVTDAVDDPDIASITGATIDVGDELVGGNGQLDINANSVWALLFEVVMN